MRHAREEIASGKSLAEYTEYEILDALQRWIKQDEELLRHPRLTDEERHIVKIRIEQNKTLLQDRVR